MIARELINDTFPPLKLSDSGLKAINWLEEFHLEHLPLVDQIDYVGLVTEEDILKLAALDQPLANQPLSLSKPFVKATQPIFEVVKVLSKHKLTAVPVLDDGGKYAGLVTLPDIMKHYAESGIFDDSNGVVVLEMHMQQYSLVHIAGIVESESAKILQVYVTPDLEKETIDVTLKINQNDLTRIIAGFERHGYNVTEHYNQGEYLGDLKSRYDALMNYLNI
ncbi:MAG: hypothetical protein RIQ89_1359 [Bacteroidota bacterium]|jgi:acetoin utilization protein AcuB